MIKKNDIKRAIRIRGGDASVITKYYIAKATAATAKAPIQLNERAAAPLPAGGGAVGAEAGTLAIEDLGSGAGMSEGGKEVGGAGGDKEGDLAMGTGAGGAEMGAAAGGLTGATAGGGSRGEGAGDFTGATKGNLEGEAAGPWAEAATTSDAKANAINAKRDAISTRNRSRGGMRRDRSRKQMIEIGKTSVRVGTAGKEQQCERYLKTEKLSLILISWKERAEGDALEPLPRPFDQLWPSDGVPTVVDLVNFSSVSTPVNSEFPRSSCRTELIELETVLFRVHGGVIDRPDFDRNRTAELTQNVNVAEVCDG